MDSYQEICARLAWLLCSFSSAGGLELGICYSVHNCRCTVIQGTSKVEIRDSNISKMIFVPRYIYMREDFRRLSRLRGWRRLGSLDVLFFCGGFFCSALLLEIWSTAIRVSRTILAKQWTEGVPLEIAYSWRVGWVRFVQHKSHSPLSLLPFFIILFYIRRTSILPSCIRLQNHFSPSRRVQHQTFRKSRSYLPGILEISQDLAGI